MLNKLYENASGLATLGITSPSRTFLTLSNFGFLAFPFGMIYSTFQWYCEKSQGPANELLKKKKKQLEDLKLIKKKKLGFRLFPRTFDPLAPSVHLDLVCLRAVHFARRKTGFSLLICAARQNILTLFGYVRLKSIPPWREGSFQTTSCWCTGSSACDIGPS